MQEQIHPSLVDLFDGMNIHNVLLNGFSPSIFNGGLNQPEVAPALALMLTVGALADLRDIQKRMRQGLRFNEWAADSVAGDQDFDPLGIAANLPVTERFELQEAEIINGRLAMLVLAAYTGIELGLGVPVIRFSPDLLPL